MPLLLTVLTTLAMPQAPDPSTQLVDDPDEDAFVVTVGPMDMPASHGEMHDMSEMHMGVFPPVEGVRVPHDAYLYGFDYEIHDGSGRTLPNLLLHHLNIADPGHRELFLPITQRVMAAGRETGAKSMPWLLFGLPVKEDQELVVSAMMHNPTPEDYAGVTLTIRLKYVPASRPWPFFRVYPFQLDVAFPAGDKGFDLPPGPFSRSYEARPAMAGRIMVIGGHLHPYATGITFEDVTAGRVIFHGEPIGKGSADLEGVTVGRLYWGLGEKIYPDHTYRVTVTYDNPTGQVIPDGGMGVVAGVFIPSGDDPWPVADTSDELYRLDLAHYTRRLHGKYADLVAAFKGAARPDSAMAAMPGMVHRH